MPLESIVEELEARGFGELLENSVGHLGISGILLCMCADKHETELLASSYAGFICFF